MTKHISLDLGRTMFDTNKSKRVAYGKTHVYPTAEHCLPVVSRWATEGHRLSIISRLGERYHEARLCMSLVYNNILPNLIDAEEVRFCHEPHEKGLIAAETKPLVHIDDRIHALNAVHKAGVPYKIMFIGIADDRDEWGQPDFGRDEGLFIATTWEEIERIVASLPSS